MNRFFAAGAQTVLAVGAHPDDIEVGAGGLVARLVEEGTKVTMVIVSVPTERETRIKEAREGARLLGADVLVLYEGRQCRVEDIPMYELVRRLDNLIGDLQPDLIITHSEHDLHWDHGLVHRAVVSACRRTPCDLLAFLSSFEMNAQSRAIGQCFVDVSTTIEDKLAAISAHQSQLAKMDLGSARDLARALGRMSGVPYAEALEVLRMKI
jgi:LmbE family N-acetylglucosaminyl deacetylase